MCVHIYVCMCIYVCVLLLRGKVFLSVLILLCYYHAFISRNRTYLTSLWRTPAESTGVAVTFLMNREKVTPHIFYYILFICVRTVSVVSGSGFVLARCDQSILRMSRIHCKCHLPVVYTFR